MATSAFRSTSQRTPVAKSSSSAAAATADDSFSSTRNSSAHRRSRSLSRFSRPVCAPADEFSDDLRAPKGRFVNTVRGSGFPDVTLDDLGVRFFGSADRGRSASRSGDVSPGEKVGSVSQRRGRSVSRHGKANVGNSSGGGGRLNSENNSRRRRSVSVVRCQISDSESDLDLYQKSNNGGSLKSSNGRNNQDALANKTTVSNHKQGLRRSLSQRDLKYHDGYSTHSSVITDDEGRDARSNKNGTERIIRTVYTEKKGMRKPSASILANDGCSKPKNSDAVRAVSMMKKNYATKLEMSEKRKQELLEEILLEDQRGRELKELLIDAKDNVEEKPIRTRKRSNDRKRMTQRLNEEAEKYFEDFISNVEDTDISSLDGNFSDTSSSIGGITKTRTFQSPFIPKSVPVEMDGVLLPWLKWETSNDTSPKIPEPKTNFVQDITSHSASSCGSWSPGVGQSINVEELSRSFHSQISKPRVDVEEYLNRQSEEDFLFEKWKQQQRIDSGGFLLCNQMFF